MCRGHTCGFLRGVPGVDPVGVRCTHRSPARIAQECPPSWPYRRMFPPSARCPPRSVCLSSHPVLLSSHPLGFCSLWPFCRLLTSPLYRRCCLCGACHGAWPTAATSWAITVLPSAAAPASGAFHARLQTRAPGRLPGVLCPRAGPWRCRQDHGLWLGEELVHPGIYPAHRHSRQRLCGHCFPGPALPFIR